MKALTIILTLISFLFLSHTVVADSSLKTKMYNEAQQAYFDQSYQVAENKFLKLISLEPDNGYLLYNLGNVYFKIGRLGKAIQYYEKAMLFAPRLHELQLNLNKAKEKQGDKIKESFSDYLVETFYFWQAYVTLSELKLVLILVSFLFWGVIFYRFIKNKKIISTRTSLGLILLLYFSCGYYLKNNVSKLGLFAVVIKPRVEVKAIYMDKGKPLFELHGGSKVKVIDKQEFDKDKKWYRISLPEGQKGWVLADDIGVI